MESRACYGCLPAKPDIRDYKICSSNANVEYPKEFKLLNLPRIKDLGLVNSCCAHATSSILEYHSNNDYLLSTNFIYGILKKLFNLKSMGMYLKDTLEISRQIGDMLEDDCEGNNEIPICYSIAEKALNDYSCVQRASAFKILSYYLCTTDNDIKYALMNYGPVLCAVDWRSEFKIINNTVFFDLTSQGGGHAVCVVGWTEDGWLVLNSWGKDFGNDGRFILPFNYGFMEARAIIDEENDDKIDSTVLIKPARNKLVNLYYTIRNFINNLFGFY